MRAGLVTGARLRGAHFERLFPDVYRPRSDDAAELTLLSTAAYLYGRERGVCSGYSAAELLGASCAPRVAPAELTVPVGGVRPRPGLLVRRERLRADEVREIGTVRVTTELRTAFDLGRRLELVEAVVALDALARRGRFAPGLLLDFAARYPRARGRTRLPRVVALSDRRAESPMESRLRLLLVLNGLPPPQVQHPVLDDRRRRAVWLDLAYPDHRVGIEYEGLVHTEPDRVLRDVGRYTDLVDKGWRIYRFSKREIYREPDEIVAKIRRALGG